MVVQPPLGFPCTRASPLNPGFKQIWRTARAKNSPIRTSKNLLLHVLRTLRVSSFIINPTCVIPAPLCHPGGLSAIALWRGLEGRDPGSHLELSFLAPLDSLLHGNDEMVARMLYGPKRYAILSGSYFKNYISRSCHGNRHSS